MAGETVCMELGKAVTDCVPQMVAEDVWTQVAQHGAGGSSAIQVINRSIIYRLHPPEGGGEPFLVVLNGLTVDEDADQPFEGLRALEASTGALVRFVLSPGAAHHMSLQRYAQVFPNARVCVAAGRIPRVNPELMAEPNVEAYPIDAPPAELAAAGLKVLVVGGLMEGPVAKRFQTLSFNFGYVRGSTEPLVVVHEPTGTITSGGHQWWFVPSGEKDVFSSSRFVSFMLKLMTGADPSYLVPGKITLAANRTFVVHDRAALQASCVEILTWDFDRLLDVHAQLGRSPETGAKALFTEALGPIAAGEWDKVPYAQDSLPT